MQRMLTAPTGNAGDQEGHVPMPSRRSPSQPPSPGPNMKPMPNATPITPNAFARFSWVHREVAHMGFHRAQRDFSGISHKADQGRRHCYSLGRGLRSCKSTDSCGSQVVPAGTYGTATSDIEFQIGGITVKPLFAGITEAGLFQFNLTIPAGSGSRRCPGSRRR